MDKIQLAKTAVNIVVGAGTVQIVSTIVKNQVPAENTLQQVTLFAGRLVLGQMVSDQAEKYTDAKIDNAVDWYKKNFNNESA